MKKISVTIITKNEKDKIRDCLESVKWADEIVVVDSFSTDNTVSICREYTDKVYQREWPGHIEQKNRAIDLTSNQWVLSLDADERITKELADEICALKMEGLEKYSAYSIPRQVFYMGKPIRHCGWYPARKLRLFDKKKSRWGGENPHDRIYCSGSVGKLRGDMLHYSFDSIASHIVTINSFTSIAALERKKKGIKGSIPKLILRAPGNFLKMYFLKMGFLDGLPGFIICVLSTMHVFVKYAKLIENDYSK